jgi:DNA-binding transcriptional LysR family regulator
MTATATAPRNRWLGIELRHLAALTAIAREGSFRGAADALGYVQSAVSQQVAHLETVVGCRLIVRERGSAPAALTPAGDLLLEHAEGIMSRFGAAQADLEQLSDGGGNRLRVGACSSLAAGMLPQVLPAVLERLPGLRLDVREGDGPELAARIAEGSLDAAFAELPVPEGPFAFADLGADGYVLLARAGAAPELRTLADLIDLPLIDHALMGPVDQRLRGLGAAPAYAVRCRSQAALRPLVAGGAGYAIVPGLSHTDELGDAVQALALDALIPPRRIGLLWHDERGRSPAVERLAELSRARGHGSVASVVQAPVDDRAAPRPATVAVPVRAAAPGATAAPALGTRAVADDACRHPARDAA